MEPIEPPWQAVKEWIPDDEPDLDWFNRPRNPSDPDPDGFDQSPVWTPEEIPLGDGRTLVRRDTPQKANSYQPADRGDPSSGINFSPFYSETIRAKSSLSSSSTRLVQIAKYLRRVLSTRLIRALVFARVSDLVSH